jgi:heme/copper-type cytochrome/quinol oxidase subunit 3
MVLLIATEATLFLLLVAAYFYLRFYTEGSWPPAPLSDPKISNPALATLVLVASTVPIALAGRAARQGRLVLIRLALVAALVLGIGFLVFQGVLVHEQLAKFKPQENAYASIYYTLIGTHYAHAVAGVLLGLWALVRSRLMKPERHLTLEVTALYWYFVNAVALLVFVTLYLAPRW